MRIIIDNIILITSAFLLMLHGKLPVELQVILLIGTIAYAAFSYCVECAGIQLVLSAVWLITLYCIDGGVFYYRQK